MKRIAQLFFVTCIFFCMTSSAWSAVATQNWKIKIRVDGSGTYGYAVAGVKDTATDGNDLAWDVQAKLDNLNVSASDPYIYVYFPHPEYTSPIVYSPSSRVGLSLSECVKDPHLPKEWIIEIDSNITGELTISWPDLAANLPAYKVTLTDLGDPGMKTINMQEAMSFSFDNIGGSLHQFKLSINESHTLESEPYFLSAIVKNKTVRLSWEMAVEEDANHYIVYRMLDNGVFAELQSLNITENQFTDRLGKEIEPISGQTQLTYKIATVNAAGEVIHSSIEVSLF